MSELAGASSQQLPSDRVKLESGRFTSAWETGKQPCIEDYLKDTSEHERAALLRRLVQLDIYYRRQRGAPLGPQEYVPRFPDLDQDWLFQELEATPYLHPPADPFLTGPLVDRGQTTPVEHLLRCPHCHSPLPATRQVGQILCRECGGSFRLEDGGSQATVDGPQRRHGRFRLLEQVGRGSFGAVWRAYDTVLERTVALKIPHVNLLASENYRERFQREARAVAQLRHPGIVHLYEVATVDGLPGLVSDFIEGVRLRDYHDARPLAFRETAALIADVADALNYAHGRRVIHRDIKPANIMMEFSRDGAPESNGHAQTPGPGRPVVVDFGLAMREEVEVVLTTDGAVIGTPAYMSPEQAAGRGHQVDGRSDEYSLGVVLYELLTGEQPFRGSKPMLIHQILHEEPRALRRINDRIPRDLETICLKALAKEPGRRYRTAGETAADLRRFLRGEPIHARPVGRLERAGRWCRRNPAIASLGAGVALAIVLVIAGSWAFAASAVQHAQTVEKLNGKLDGAKRDSDRRWYCSEILLAARDWQEGQTAALLHGLDQFVAPVGSGDPRGFEWHYLRRLCDLDLATLSGHGGPALAVVATTDGQLLAAGGKDGKIGVWDVASGRQVLSLDAHKGAVRAMSLGTDGHQLASGGDDGVVRLWELPFGNLVREFVGATAGITCLHFSRDGGRLVAGTGGAATGGYDRHGKDVPGGVLGWEVATGRQSFALPPQRSSVWAIAIHPDKRRLALACQDRTMALWDIPTGKSQVVFDGYKEIVRCLLFTSDGRLVSGDEAGLIRVLGTAMPQEMAVLRGHNKNINALAIGQGGHLVSGGSDGTVRIWDLDQSKELLVLRGHHAAVRSVANLDGRRIASASDDGTLKLWDARATQEHLVLPERGTAQCVAFDRHGRVATGGVGNSVTLWEAVTGKKLMAFQGQTASPCGLAFRPDGTSLACAGADGNVQVWNTVTNRLSWSIRAHEKAASCVAYSPNGSQLASGGEDGSICVSEAKTGREMFRVRAHPDVVWALAYDTDGGLLISAGRDGTVKIWETFGGRELGTFAGHQCRVFGLAVQPGGGLVASAGEDGTVQVWDLVTQEVKHRLGVSATAGALAVCFSPDGHRVAASDWVDSVKIWDVHTGQELLTLRGSGLPFFSLAFSPDGLRLAGGSADTFARIWDASPLTPEVRELREARSLVQFLESQSLPGPEIQAKIHKDRTISDAVRQKALALADHP